jgi:putative transferase (TIGR04331 family)
VKILHDTPESAAMFICEVYHRVDDWWFSKPVQEVREEFASRFALTDKQWNQKWLKAICRNSS